jgi:hypothetical protein
LPVIIKPEKERALSIRANFAYSASEMAVSKGILLVKEIMDYRV